MTTWTSTELNRIGKAEELQIASLRRDGTLRKPVIIWAVRVGDDLYMFDLSTDERLAGSVVFRHATRGRSGLGVL